MTVVGGQFNAIAGFRIKWKKECTSDMLNDLEHLEMIFTVILISSLNIAAVHIFFLVSGCIHYRVSLLVRWTL